MRIMAFFCAVLLASVYSPRSAYAGHYYKTPYYPNMEDAQKMASRASGNILDVCCYLPTGQEIAALKAANLSEIKIRASYFPTAQELQNVEALGIPYTLILDEVFPSEQDTALLNRSKIKLLHILSRDFPTLGEVTAFNQFTIPVRFDMLKMRLPRMEEMVVIHQFKPSMTVGFYNNKVPGPGHAGFFNDLNTNKVFVVLEQFPWGIDAEGFALLQRSALEIDPSEVLMPQDLFVLNQFNVLPTVRLREIGPSDSDWADNVKKIKAQKILIGDSGNGEFLNSTYAQSISANAQSPIIFQFNSYY